MASFMGHASASSMSHVLDGSSVAVLMAATWAMLHGLIDGPWPAGDGSSGDGSWSDGSYGDGRVSHGWSDGSWSDGSWSDAGWSDGSWSDGSWSDVGWSDDGSWRDFSRRADGSGGSRRQMQTDQEAADEHFYR